MADSKSKLRTYLHIFLPTYAGLFIYTMLMVFTMILYQAQTIRQYLAFPNQLNAQNFIVTHLDRLLHSTLGEARTNIVVVGLFWAVVGLFVYIFLRGMARLIYELGEDLEERRYLWPKGSNRYKPLELLAERALFRIAVFIALIFYVVHVLSTILSGPVFPSFATTSAVLQYVFWFVIGCVIWHGLTVLLRLLVLRARLFG